MKIVMVRAYNTNAGSEKRSLVWWWRVREDNDQAIEDGVGWDFKKETAYAAATKFFRAEKARREKAA